MKKLIPLLVLGTLSTAAPKYGSMTDSRDGQTYKTVKIGTQTWMAQNLNYKPSSGNSWCYDDKKSNCQKYGRLYDWNTANEVCPSGWHLPTDDEWKILEIYVGLTQTEADAQGDRGTIGTKLKSTIGWLGSQNIGTDDFGFSALPAGGRDYYGSLFFLGDVAYFWSASQSGSSNAWFRSLYSNFALVGRDSKVKSYGYSIRCLKDN